MKEIIKWDEKCPLCSSCTFLKLYGGVERFDRHYDVYQCSQCGLGITHPFPAKSYLDEIYSLASYRAHEKRFIGLVEELIHYFRRERLRRIERFCRSGRLLDIGCGRGLMLSMAKDDGWDAFGFEYSKETASHARDDLGLDVRYGNFRDAGFEYGTFDVVTIWHVLEHLADPVEVIAECNNLLRPGGLLVVSLPNIQSIQSHMSGKNWFHLDVPYHLYHFSEASLKRLMEMNSFNILNIDHFSFEHNLFGFVQSMLNMTGIRHNFLYDLMKTKSLRIKAGADGYYRNLLGTVMLLPGVILLSAGLSVIEPLIERGGTFEVYARKTGK